jgi:glycosyltransferase involved in cell wall biosynthesis
MAGHGTSGVNAASQASGNLVLGIDASRNRSGGARAHLRGILEFLDPAAHGISKVHLWSSRSLADSIPDRPWLVKHCPPALEGSLLGELWWQFRHLKSEAASCGCDLMFATDASTVGRFKPMVVLSQDLLSYEPRALGLYGFSSGRLRILTILWLQNLAFRASSGVIFLTRHSAEAVQKSCGRLARTVVIPHGVGEDFRVPASAPRKPWPEAGAPIRCVYVSNAELYKHHAPVVRGIAALRARGHNVTLTLIGGGTGRAQKLLERQMAESDPKGEFVKQLEFVAHGRLPGLVAESDLFVFASSCEAFGITLLEGMASGLPIACSDRSSLPEILQDGGVYFDPEEDVSIAAAVERLILDGGLREFSARRARGLAEAYSWRRCSEETFSFITQTSRAGRSALAPDGRPSR